MKKWQLLKKRYVLAIVLPLFFSFFVFGEVKAEEKCGCLNVCSNVYDQSSDVDCLEKSKGADYGICTDESFVNYYSGSKVSGCYCWGEVEGESLTFCADKVTKNKGITVPVKSSAGILINNEIKCEEAVTTLLKNGYYKDTLGKYKFSECKFFIDGAVNKSYPPPAAPSSSGAPKPPSPAGTATTPEATGSASPGGYQSSNEATKNWIKENYKMPTGYDGVIPECAFSGTCENVNDLLQLGINIGKYVFSIIGSVAFLAFVYGGFTIVFSFGSAEKVKKGTEVLIAAVTGMAIAFGAYMLINFILDALNVTQDFRGIK